MKRAGIITFHGADNFGAVLQCYALQSYLKKTGIDAFVLETNDKAISGFYKSFRFSRNIKLLIISLLQYPHNAIRHGKFKKFRKKHLHILNRPERCDMWVCGSDQIWNFNITHGYNPVYFASFDDVALKISYAASIGKELLNDDEKRIFSTELSHMDMISVREEKAKELISTLTDKNISVVPDPTLLLSRTDWSLLLSDRREKEKYILIYNLCGSKNLYDIAYVIAEKRKLHILEIRGNSKPFRSDVQHTILDDIGPIDFLNYINDAEFVVTDSFHGTVFSIIFRKNFYSIPPKGLGSRMKTLLDRLALTDRLITTVNEADVVSDMDYTNTDVRLQEFFESGKSFISEAVKRL